MASLMGEGGRRGLLDEVAAEVDRVGHRALEGGSRASLDVHRGSRGRRTRRVGRGRQRRARLIGCRAR